MDGRTARLNPVRKISETFLRFAAPILHDLPSEAPEDRAREALQVSFTAWNAVVFADGECPHGYIHRTHLVPAIEPRTSLIVPHLCTL